MLVNRKKVKVAGINLAATADTAVASGFTWLTRPGKSNVPFMTEFIYLFIDFTYTSWKVHAVASGAVLCCLPNDSQG